MRAQILGSAFTGPPARCPSQAQDSTKGTSSRYKPVQRPLAEPSVKEGSTSSGKARSATKLPELLATLREYGSREPLQPVVEYHLCRSGLVLDRIKNGRPTRRSNAPSKCRAWWLEVISGVMTRLPRARGRKQTAKAMRPAWSASPFNGVTLRDSQWA